MTADHTLSAETVTLGYGDRTVVDALDLTVPPGEITCIVGANACGKSTLLRAMARLLAPREGRVVLDGHDLHKLPTKQVAQTLGTDSWGSFLASVAVGAVVGAVVVLALGTFAAIERLERGAR